MLINVLRSVAELINRYLTLYSPCVAKPFETINNITSDFGWEDLVAQTTSEYLDLHSVDRRWSREMVEAATRVNYGQVSLTPVIVSVPNSWRTTLER